MRNRPPFDPLKVGCGIVGSWPTVLKAESAGGIFNYARAMKQFASLLTALVMLLVAGLFLFSASDGPKYHGKSADRWLSQLDGHGTSQDQARAAFSAMGAEVVPWLVRRLNSNTPARWLRWRFDFERLPGKVKILTMTAATALGDVGPPATAAIPDLLRLTHHDDCWVRSRAKAALIKIRGDKLDDIQIQLAKVEQTGEWNDLPQILVGLGPKAEGLVPALVTLVATGNPRVCGSALDILAELRLAPQIVVPTLANKLHSPDDNVRFSAAMALNQYGAMARPATTALIQAMDDKWDYVAHNAILTIEQFATAAEAKTAVPALRRLSTHHTEFIRTSAQRTLDKIQRSGPL